MRKRDWVPDPTWRNVLIETTRGPKSDALITGDIYFLHAPGLGFKIGISRTLKQRIRSLQQASPIDLVFLGSIPGDNDLERYLHRRFNRYRLRGEWFSEELLPLVARIIERPEILDVAA